MITLYHRAKSRSSRFLFLLEELGVPYDVHRVTVRDSTGGGALDPANPHPHGKVPAIVDADTGDIVYESSAIALYLTDKFPAANLGPVAGQPGRGAYLSWLAYYGGVLEPAYMSKFLDTPVPRGTAGWVVLEEAMAHVIAALSAGPYLLGAQLSAADVLYGTTFARFAGSPLGAKSPVIAAYAARVTERPAFARGMAKDEQAG